MVLHGGVQDANDAFANTQQYIADSDEDVESLSDSLYGNTTEVIAGHSAVPFDNSHTRPSVPPAALWLRGSATAMDEPNFFSPSTLSISDEYDIVDDAETASLPSSGSESDSASDSNEIGQDEEAYNGEVSRRTNSAETDSPTIETKAARIGHDVHDSLLSEDIETPRQSFWTPHRNPTSPDSDQFLRNLLLERPLHIIYLANGLCVEGKEEGIFKAMALRLSGAGMDNVSHARVIELPSPPNGRLYDSTNTVYRSGLVDLHVRRIVQGDGLGTNEVRLQDQDDLAIVHVPDFDLNSSWVSATLEQLSASTIPTLVILENPFGREFYPDTPTGFVANIISEHTLLRESPSDFFARINSIMINELEMPATDVTTACQQTKIEIPERKKRHSCSSNLRPILTTLFLALLATVFSSYYSPMHVLSLEERRDLLTEALNQHVGTSQMPTLNLTHLLQPPQAIQTGVSGLQLYKNRPSDQGTFLVSDPNHVLVSVPSLSRRGTYPKVSSVKVWKAGLEVEHNCTRLIDGVYAVDIDPSLAHGLITVNILARPPMLNLTVDANFGHQIFRRASYDKARSDLSVAVQKDLIVVSTNAKAFKAAVEADLKSGISAAKDATEQLAGQVFRDLPALAVKTAKQVEDIYQSQKSLIVVRTQKAVQLFRPANFVREMRPAYEAWLRHATKAVVPAKTIGLARERVLAIKKARWAGKKARRAGKEARRANKETRRVCKKAARELV